MKSLDVSAKSFTLQAYSVSRKGENSALILETLWKYNLKFVKDVPVIYVNFFTIVSSREKNGRHYFGTDLRRKTPNFSLPTITYYRIL